MNRHRSFVVALVATGVALPSAAFAVENAVEFQLADHVILDLIEERAQYVDPGCPQIFDSGVPGLDEVVVDHVEFGVPELLREDNQTTISFQSGTISVARPRVRLPVDVHLKSVKCVEDPQCALDDTLPLTVFLSFALTADTSQICATFTQSEGLLVPQEALDQVDEIVSGFGPMCAPLKLDAVTGLLPGATIADVGLSASAALDRIAVRLDMNTPDGAAGSTLGDWTTFMTGTLADGGAEDFSVHVDQAMLRHAFERQLTDGITCDPSDPSSDACNDEIEPTEDPTSQWTSWIPQISVGVDTDVEVPLCWDISTYVSLTSPLSLAPSGDAIDVAATLDWDPNDGEIFACSIVNPLFAFTLPIPAFFGIMEQIAADYSAANEIEGALPSECALQDDHHVDCSFPFTLPELDLGPGPNGVLTATQLRGVSTGLVLEGDVALVGAVANPTPLTLDGGAPVYGVHGGCKDLAIGYQGWLEAGGGPSYYCAAPDSGLPSPRLVNDVLDVYDLAGVDGGPTDFMELGLNGSNATFWSDPYGAIATVWTPVGSGSIELDAPIEQVGIDWGVIAEYINAYVNCNFQEQTGLFGIPGKFDFHWLVDPPPYELVAVGSVFDRATAKLEKATLTQVGETWLDEKSGATVMPAKSAVWTTTWSVDAGRNGSFTFTADTPMTTDLGGAPVFDGYAYTFAAPTTMKIAVPEKSLPKGARSATVTVTLEPGSAVLTGYAAKW